MVEDLRPPTKRSALRLIPTIGGARDKPGTGRSGKGPGAASISAVGEDIRAAPFDASRAAAAGSGPKRPLNPFKFHVRDVRAHDGGISAAGERSRPAECKPSDRKAHRIGWEQIEFKWAAMTSRAQCGPSVRAKASPCRPPSEGQPESTDAAKPKAPPVR